MERNPTWVLQLVPRSPITAAPHIKGRQKAKVIAHSAATLRKDDVVIDATIVRVTIAFSVFILPVKIFALVFTFVVDRTINEWLLITATFMILLSCIIQLILTNHLYSVHSATETFSYVDTAFLTPTHLPLVYIHDG